MTLFDDHHPWSIFCIIVPGTICRFLLSFNRHHHLVFYVLLYPFVPGTTNGLQYDTKSNTPLNGVLLFVSYSQTPLQLATQCHPQRNENTYCAIFCEAQDFSYFVFVKRPRSLHEFQTTRLTQLQHKFWMRGLEGLCH